MMTDENLRKMANQYVDFNFRIEAVKGEQPLFYDIARAYERGYRVAERESLHVRDKPNYWRGSSTKEGKSPKAVAKRRKKNKLGRKTKQANRK